MSAAEVPAAAIAAAREAYAAEVVVDAVVGVDPGDARMAAAIRAAAAVMSPLPAPTDDERARVRSALLEWWDSLTPESEVVSDRLVDLVLSLAARPAPPEDVAALLDEWDAAALPDASGRHNGGGFALDNWDRIRAALAARSLPETEEWEYGWEADPAKRMARRSEGKPLGPRVMWDGHPYTPEEIAEFPRGRRIRRRTAGPIEPVPSADLGEEKER